MSKTRTAAAAGRGAAGAAGGSSFDPYFDHGHFHDGGYEYLHGDTPRYQPKHGANLNDNQQHINYDQAQADAAADGVHEYKTSLAPALVESDSKLAEDWAFAGSSVFFREKFVVLTPGETPDRLGFMWTKHSVDSRAFRVTVDFEVGNGGYGNGQHGYANAHATPAGGDDGNGEAAALVGSGRPQQVGFWLAAAPSLIADVRKGEKYVRAKMQGLGDSWQNAATREDALRLGGGELYSKHFRDSGSLMLNQAGFEERFDGFGVVLDVLQNKMRCIADDWRPGDHAHMIGAKREAKYPERSEWVTIPKDMLMVNSVGSGPVGTEQATVQRPLISLEQTNKGWMRATLHANNYSRPPLPLCEMHLPHINLALSLGVTADTGVPGTGVNGGWTPKPIIVHEVRTTTYDFGRVSHLIEDPELRRKLHEIEVQPMKDGLAPAVERLERVLALYTQKTRDSKLQRDLVELDLKVMNLDKNSHNLLHDHLPGRKHKKVSKDLKHLALNFERQLKQEGRFVDHLQRVVDGTIGEHQNRFERWVHDLHGDVEKHTSRFHSENSWHMMGLFAVVALIVGAFFFFAHRLRHKGEGPAAERSVMGGAEDHRFDGHVGGMEMSMSAGGVGGGPPHQMLGAGNSNFGMQQQQQQSQYNHGSPGVAGNRMGGYDHLQRTPPGAGTSLVSPHTSPMLSNAAPGVTWHNEPGMQGHHQSQGMKIVPGVNNITSGGAGGYINYNAPTSHYNYGAPAPAGQTNAVPYGQPMNPSAQNPFQQQRQYPSGSSSLSTAAPPAPGRSRPVIDVHSDRALMEYLQSPSQAGITMDRQTQSSPGSMLNDFFGARNTNTGNRGSGGGLDVEV
eukprot:g16755.t1